MIPIRTDSPLRATPYMNWALILANVVIFLFQVPAMHPAAGFAPQWFDAWKLYPQDPRLLNYVSYAFLHGGWMHLLGNMLFLYIFGNNVNDKMGHLGYLAFYLAGGVLAGIAYVLWQDGGVPIVGASGAIAAVTGAYAILFPRSNITVFYFFILIGTFEIACYWFVLAFFAMDLYNLSHASPVANIAHIGGTLFGAAVSYALLAAHLLPRDQFDVVALVKQWHRRRQYRDAVAGGWNPYLNPAPAGTGGGNYSSGGNGAGAGDGGEPAAPVDPRLGRVMDLRAEISAAIAHHKLPEAAQKYVELKRVDAQQVLSRQAQLDVANQLAGLQMYAQAAEAYETFLRHYPKFEQIEQVELMLGLIYARYLDQLERARELLVRAAARLHTDRELGLAKAELSRIEPLLASRVGRP